MASIWDEMGTERFPKSLFLARSGGFRRGGGGGGKRGKFSSPINPGTNLLPFKKWMSNATMPFFILTFYNIGSGSVTATGTKA